MRNYLAGLGHARLWLEVLVTYYFKPENALLEYESIIGVRVGKAKWKILTGDPDKEIEMEGKDVLQASEIAAYQFAGSGISNTGALEH